MHYFECISYESSRLFSVKEWKKEIIASIPREIASKKKVGKRGDEEGDNPRKKTRTAGYNALEAMTCNYIYG